MDWLTFFAARTPPRRATMARVEADAPARTAPSAASPPANTSPPVAACPAPPARSPAAAEAPAPVVPLSAAEETLEEKVAAKWPRARVQRVAASATKPSALLEKLVNLACTNVRQYCSAAELRAKRGEISASTVVAILLDDRLLGYAAYRTHEREGDVSDLVTYLFELHRDMKDALAKGAGSLLEAEVEAAAAAAGQWMMLTVAEKNPARAFYGEKRWLLDRSSPQNHTSCASYLIMRKNPLDSETIGARDARFWEAEPPEEEPPKKKRRLSPRANRNIPLDEALDRLRLRQITTQGYNNSCLAFATRLRWPFHLRRLHRRCWLSSKRRCGATRSVFARTHCSSSGLRRSWAKWRALNSPIPPRDK